MRDWLLVPQALEKKQEAPIALFKRGVFEIVVRDGLVVFQDISDTVIRLTGVQSVRALGKCSPAEVLLGLICEHLRSKGNGLASWRIRILNAFANTNIKKPYMKCLLNSMNWRE